MASTANKPNPFLPARSGRDLSALLPRELLVAAVAVGGGVGCHAVAGHALHVEGAVDAVGATPLRAATTAAAAANGFTRTQHDVVLVHDFRVAVDVDVVGDELPDGGAARAAGASVAAKSSGLGGRVAIVAQPRGAQLEGEAGAGAGEGGGGFERAGVNFGGGEGRVLRRRGKM